MTLVFGAMKDKDVDGILSPLLPLFDACGLHDGGVAAGACRRQSWRRWRERCRRAGRAIESIEDPAAALRCGLPAGLRGSSWPAQSFWSAPCVVFFADSSNETHRERARIVCGRSFDAAVHFLPRARLPLRPSRRRVARVGAGRRRHLELQEPARREPDRHPVSDEERPGHRRDADDPDRRARPASADRLRGHAPFRRPDGSVRRPSVVATGNVLFESQTQPDRGRAPGVRHEDAHRHVLQRGRHGQHGHRVDRSMFGTQEPDAMFRGDEVHKLGPDTYKIVHGAFTTCVQPTPRWEMVGGSVTLKLDDHAFLTNSTLRVKGVPVMYLPAFYYPVQERRPGDRLSDPDLRSLHRPRAVAQQRVLLGDRPQPGRDVPARLVLEDRSGGSGANTGTSSGAATTATPNSTC